MQALAADETQVTPRLAALVRKELIGPHRPQLTGEDGFRFRHLLIRDAAYDALPKAVRAELHERFATWLERQGAELIELDEVLGYHLEQACRYRAELGLPEDGLLAAAARRHLTAAGRRAYVRADQAGAVSLLERAAGLVPSAELDLALEIVLGEALFSTGRGDDALERAGSLVERATASGDRVGELFGKIQEGILHIHLEPEGAAEKLTALSEQALPVFEAADDDLALYTAHIALARVAHLRAQMDTQMEALERAVAHARRAGLPYELLLGWRGAARLFGTTPVSELLAWLDEQREQAAWSQQFQGLRAHALAMLGRFEEARAILAEVRAELADRGGGVPLGLRLGQGSIDVELLAGDPAAAVEFGEEGCRLLDELGAQSFLSTAAAKLAQALYALDRLEEAETWAGRAAELGASDDAMTQMLWRQVSAKVLARRGEHAKAERMARGAVAVGEETDILNAQGDTLADLAEVLLLAGRPEEAAASLEQAIDRYQRKGNRVSTERAQTRLEALQHPARR